MSSCYCNTPYLLNLKLKTLHKYPLKKTIDVNMLYKNLKSSIPELTNQFCILKKRTNEISKSLNKIKLVTNNCNSSRSNYNSLSKSIRTTPNISNYNYDYSYLSQKPLLKSYQNINIQNRNNLLNYKCNTKSNNKIKLNFNYSSEFNSPNKINNNRNYSAINTKREKRNDINKYALNFEKSNGNIKRNEINKYEYEKEIKKLNKKIYEKDKIILKMKGIIDDTFNKLDRRKKINNQLIRNEILNSKNDKNYWINNKFNFNKNNNIYENKRYKNNTNQRIERNVYKRKKLDVNNNKFNNLANEYSDYYNNKTYEDNMELKWEEIRKLNKKADNLLNGNQNN